MKFTETQRKLDELMNDYEMAVIGENRGRNRSGYNTKEDKYYQKRRELKEFVAELEEAQRWIPVSERLPDNWESVLTIDISKSTRDMVTAFYNPETSLWSTHFSCDLWVTHWMPLPESPIVYGKVCEE